MRTRFAPSPTGPLHLGHAYSAMLAHDMALRDGGEFLLRIEDIDQTRARPEWEELIYDDLRWLGLSWDGPVMRQSERMQVYATALDTLWERGLLYPCICTRRDIEMALGAPQEGVEPQTGPDGPVYPGTCRNRMSRERTFSELHPRPQATTLRLEMILAVFSNGPFSYRIDSTGGVGHHYAGFWEGGGRGAGWERLVEFTSEDLVKDVGDIVLARRDMGTSYHLSVVIDDAAQGHHPCHPRRRPF